jgi:peptidoglycan/LPS O-acetylase OafA/YrhL
MRSHLLNVAIMAAALVAVVVTGDLFLSANFGSFENPDLTLFHRLLPLWCFLEFVPGFIIGFRASRWPKGISAIAYAIGVAINYYRFDGYGIAREVPMPWSKYFLVMLYNMATAALIGAALALMGQLFRRLTSRWSGRAA